MNKNPGALAAPGKCTHSSTKEKPLSLFGSEGPVEFTFRRRALDAPPHRVQNRVHLVEPYLLVRGEDRAHLVAYGLQVEGLLELLALHVLVQGLELILGRGGVAHGSRECESRVPGRDVEALGRRPVIEDDGADLLPLGGCQIELVSQPLNHAALAEALGCLDELALSARGLGDLGFDRKHGGAGEEEDGTEGKSHGSILMNDLVQGRAQGLENQREQSGPEEQAGWRPLPVIPG